MDNNLYLKHHGVKGMRWGVRRYQNYDGSLKNPKKINSKSETSKNKNTQRIKKLAKVGSGAVALGSAVAAYKNVGNIYVAKKYLAPSAKAVTLASSKAAIQTGASVTAVMLATKAFNPKQKLDSAPSGPYAKRR